MTEMDVKTAIEYMRSIRRTPANWILEYEAIDKAIEALEKQTPKKPIENGIDRYCPICGNYVGYVDAMATDITNYCYECGQAVNWESVES